MNTDPKNHPENHEQAPAEVRIRLVPLEEVDKAVQEFEDVEAWPTLLMWEAEGYLNTASEAKRIGHDSTARAALALAHMHMQEALDMVNHFVGGDHE